MIQLIRRPPAVLPGALRGGLRSPRRQQPHARRALITIIINHIHITITLIIVSIFGINITSTIIIDINLTITITITIIIIIIIRCAPRALRVPRADGRVLRRRRAGGARPRGRTAARAEVEILK